MRTEFNTFQAKVCGHLYLKVKQLKWFTLETTPQTKDLEIGRYQISAEILQPPLGPLV